MSQYVITYIGGDKPSTKEQGMQHKAKYMEWLSSLGAAAVSPANPIMNTHTVKPNGSVEKGGVSSMSGYTVVEADSIEDAIEMAKTCPFLEINGTLEVSETMKMPG